MRVLQSEFFIWQAAADPYPLQGEQLRVDTVETGPGRGEVRVVLAGRIVLTLDWSETDRLAGMLGEAADALYTNCINRATEWED